MLFIEPVSLDVTHTTIHIEFRSVYIMSTVGKRSSKVISNFGWCMVLACVINVFLKFTHKYVSLR